ncbi:hypothetical protein F511_29251 [Dorcoceras hygrometricum]|uniref:Uncharacterized protein n=1 Tax=Dorcoceras hygrometricum TaxID=472368 RepID=A0A2Z7AX62_9LAMI|nr:hypothetical protein F511_29251 [Dorcoceras hygrometricum]
MEQLKQHKMEWTQPSTSNLFGGAVDQRRGIHSQFYPNVDSTSWVRPLIFMVGSWQVVEGADSKSTRPYSTIVQRNWADICIDVVQFSLFGHLQPVGSTCNTCKYLIVIDSVLSSETVPSGIFDAIQHGQSAEGFVDFFVQQISDSSSSSSPSSSSSSLTSSSDSHSIRAGADSRTCRGSNLNFHRRLPDSSSLLHSLRRDKIWPLGLKSMKFASRYRFKRLLCLKKLTVFRLETHEGLNTLRAQMSEIIAYINRGRDDKKGEESNRGPQPEDRSRPSGGGRGGSRSEPSKRIAVDTTPIRSTTRTETFSSGCTRSTDEFCTNGFSSSRWPEANFRRRSAAAAVAVENGGEGRLASRFRV